MRSLKRRRRENITDYGKRLKLLKGGFPRLVFRKTNKYLISQYISSKQAKDTVELGVTSNSLMKYGWPEESKGSLKSISAAYLTGFLMGKLILKNKKKNPIMDFGMLKTIPKSNIYSFIKGVIESGVEIKCKESSFPDKERINGKFLKKDFTKTFEEIKSKINKEQK